MSVSSVAVVGAGPVGLSIAEAVAEAEVPVTVYCVTAGSSAHARRRLARTLELRKRIGQIEDVEAIFERVCFTRDLSATCEADLVIESAVGDIRARRALLATLETRMSRGSVLASNTTRGQLASMAEALMRPDQFIGMRFFHPATTTPLVEVLPLPETAPGALVACYTFCRWLKKTPVEQVIGAVDTPPRLRMPKIAAR